MVTTNIFVHNASEHTFNGNLSYNHIMDVAGGKGETWKEVLNTVVQRIQISFVTSRRNDLYN
jgi:hypothetical protein